MCVLFRYGSIFKTHILGCPCVMISSPEAAKLVLVTKAHLFKPTFPASKERMLGKQAIFFHQGDYHSKLRKLVLRAFTPETIRNIVPDIESIAIQSLSSWEGRMINTYQEMKTVSSRTEFPLFSLSPVYFFSSLNWVFNFLGGFYSTHSMLHCYPYLEKTKFYTEKI